VQCFSTIVMMGVVWLRGRRKAITVCVRRQQNTCITAPEITKNATAAPVDVHYCSNT